MVVVYHDWVKHADVLKFLQDVLVFQVDHKDVLHHRFSQQSKDSEAQFSQEDNYSVYDEWNHEITVRACASAAHSNEVHQWVVVDQILQ